MIYLDMYIDIGHFWGRRPSHQLADDLVGEVLEVVARDGGVPKVVQSRGKDLVGGCRLRTLLSFHAAEDRRKLFMTERE